MEVLTMIKEAIIKIVNKGDLTYDEAHQGMMEIMKGETTRLRTPLSWLPFRREHQSRNDR